MHCGILTAVGAAVADAVRVAADHLADGNLAAAPRPIQPLLVQHVLDHHKLRVRLLSGGFGPVAGDSCRRWCVQLAARSR